MHVAPLRLHRAGGRQATNKPSWQTPFVLLAVVLTSAVLLVLRLTASVLVRHPLAPSSPQMSAGGGAEPSSRFYQKGDVIELVLPDHPGELQACEARAAPRPSRRRPRIGYAPARTHNTQHATNTATARGTRTERKASALTASRFCVSWPIHPSRVTFPRSCWIIRNV